MTHMTTFLDNMRQIRADLAALQAEVDVIAARAAADDCPADEREHLYSIAADLRARLRDAAEFTDRAEVEP
jgi:hypothetical protein